MSVQKVIEQFGVSSTLLLKLEEESTRPVLDALYKNCSEIRSRFQIIVDNSPVMASADSFAAKIEHDTGKIILNGYLLAKTGDEDVFRDFLIFHELAHEVLKSPVFDLDLDLEQSCDLIALHAISQKYERH